MKVLTSVNQLIVSNLFSIDASNQRGVRPEEYFKSREEFYESRTIRTYLIIFDIDNG
jgi:hypothetical protein